MSANTPPTQDMISQDNEMDELVISQRLKLQTPNVKQSAIKNSRVLHIFIAINIVVIVVIFSFFYLAPNNENELLIEKNNNLTAQLEQLKEEKIRVSENEKTEIENLEFELSKRKEDLLKEKKTSLMLEEKLNKQLKQKKKARRRLPYVKVFDEAPHKLQIIPEFKFFRINYADYLNKKDTTRVLEINCGEECKKKYATDQEYKKLEADFDNVTKKSYNWVNVHNNKTNPSEIIMQVKKHARFATDGVTLFFKNLEEYKTFKTSYQEFFLSQMRDISFVYDETTSLNLRRREGCIILIFTKDAILNNPPFPLKQPTKNYIAVQTVLKFNENLPYLREWIGYHVHLGIDKIFLYDNNGTEGHPGGKSNETHNKYYFPLECLNMTNEYIIEEFNSIWEQFYEHIVYVPWQPTDEKGQIIYGHINSMKDYINNFEDVTTFTGFIDVDEMFFSELDLNLDEYLSQKSLEGWTAVSFQQRKMVNRFCYNNSRMMDMMNLSFEVNTRKWAEKQIFQNNQYYPGPSIHEGRVFEGRIFPINNKTEWRLNHYNFNLGMVTYSQNVRHSNATKLIIDDSGKRYKEALDKICMGKCSERFKLVCNIYDRKESGRFRCPIFEKEYPISALAQKKN